MRSVFIELACGTAYSTPGDVAMVLYFEGVFSKEEVAEFENIAVEDVVQDTGWFIRKSDHDYLGSGPWLGPYTSEVEAIQAFAKAYDFEGQWTAGGER
jgi:hypothetical protein